MKSRILYILICTLSFFMPRLQAQDPLNLIIVDEQGEAIDRATLNIQPAPQEETSWMCRIGETFLSWFDRLRIKFWGEEQIQRDLDYIEREIIGGNFLRLAGKYSEPSNVGVYGGGEIHDKVRITFINGILCIREDVIATAKLISETHGGSNVCYIFRPTQGWSWDIVKSTLVKSGFVSQQALDIVTTWRALIKEMGGVGAGGSIVHYAHSIGAADTYIARRLLAPEEVAMVSVYTFGSPIVFPDEHFRLVRNYASVRDGVPLLRRSSLGFGEDNVIYVGSYDGWPIIDHLLDNDTYRAVLHKLGQEFIEKYVYFDSENEFTPMVINQ